MGRGFTLDPYFTLCLLPSPTHTPHTHTYTHTHTKIQSHSHTNMHTHTNAHTCILYMYMYTHAYTQIARSGKSSISKVVFHKLSPNETLFLESTSKVVKDDINNSSFVQFQVGTLANFTYTQAVVDFIDFLPPLSIRFGIFLVR